ncbi:MAG: hypothetical protein DLM53_12555 [Candidatus Eremiobacter antarcticus]|nr:hypothetical protein [Candidatus Eremiobacteraeota bacterium]PZR60478.1 MAG: hypothetical protein DLM53_12555 [Candidatus Eremiobacter sp. RRmetagenome_bin22]
MELPEPRFAKPTSNAMTTTAMIPMITHVDVLIDVDVVVVVLPVLVDAPFVPALFVPALPPCVVVVVESVFVVLAAKTAANCMYPPQ